MSKSAYVATAGFALCASINAYASSTRVQCPAQLAPASIQLVDTPVNWTPLVRAPLYLHSAAPIYGAPEARGDIADFSTKRGSDYWSYTYRLEGKFDDGKWIQCAYGANNEITLSRKISNDIRQCTFTYRKGRKVAQHEIAIDCD